MNFALKGIENMVSHLERATSHLQSEIDDHAAEIERRVAASVELGKDRDRAALVAAKFRELMN